MAPVWPLRRNSRPGRPLSSRALAARRGGTRLPGSEIEPCFDDAVVTENDTQSRVGAHQASLSDRDPVGAST